MIGSNNIQTSSSMIYHKVSVFSEEKKKLGMFTELEQMPRIGESVTIGSNIFRVTDINHNLETGYVLIIVKT